MGCQQMDAVTYPNPAVTHFIQSDMIPVRIQSNNETLSLKFKIKWTPTLIILDKDGNEHYRSVGFLRPEALLVSLMLGIGRTHLDRGEYQEAISHFDKVLAKSLKSDFTAQAIYFRGVARYKLTNDLSPLKEAYDKLSEEYPDSEWTEKAYPYKGLDI
jgi:tetratricopeptide (TPR) repeat protein